MCEILRDCGIAGGFESLKRERTLLLAKAKRSKNFFRFCGIAESRVDLRFACEILRNCGIEGKHRICGGFCEILRNCGIAGGFELVRLRGFYFLRKQKVAKAFTHFV